jgi:hypothetical protein
MDFEKLYQNTHDSLKLKYLDAIIGQNNNLKEEFINFVKGVEGSSKGLSYEGFIEIIQDIQNDYKGRFEAVDTENPDWESYHPPYSGYIEDWQAYQYASEQEFEAIFEDFRNKAINAIIEQSPDTLIAMLIGLYEATQDADIEDEVCSFDDVKDHLLSEHKNSLNAIIDKLRLGALAENKIGSAFDLFLKYCANEYPENSFFPAHFEPLLIALSEKSDNPARLLELLIKSGVDQDCMPELLLVLNKKAGNATEWLKSAQRLYKQNVPVAQALLEYYFEADISAFLATARELYPTNNYMWAEFLRQYLTPQLDKDLFVEVFRKLTVANRELEPYHKIREFLNETEFQNLLEEIKWDTVFRVKILEVEERYSDIKNEVDKNTSSRHFAEIIAPILKVYPEFCFRKIESLTTSTLQTERGRHIYELIASWLKLAEEIPGFEAECQRLIQQTYTHKPNLPALKDEMRKAGLVK